MFQPAPGEAECVRTTPAHRVGPLPSYLWSFARTLLCFTLPSGDDSTPPLTRLSEVVLNINVKIAEPPGPTRDLTRLAEPTLISRGTGSPAPCFLGSLDVASCWPLRTWLFFFLSALQNPREASQSGYDICSSRISTLKSRG